MHEKIMLDMLTSDSVSVKIQSFVDMEGIEYPIGKPHRKAYVNSPSGRLGVQAELPQSQQDAIFAIWGESPSIEEVN